MSTAAEDVGRDSGGAPGLDTPDGSTSEGSVAHARRSKKKQLSVWQEMGLLLGIALVLAIVIKALFMQAFYIPSGSMRDTLVKDDRILVQKISYWRGDPERGDVIVFEDSASWLQPTEVRSADDPVSLALELFGLYPTGGHLVKRVIGVGGDTVMCCDKRGRMVVNGVALNEEDYLAAGEKPSLRDFEVVVPEGHIWVQGDNRSNSADSRGHLGDPGGGFISTDRVVGKVFTVLWPRDRAKLIHRPAAFDSLD